MEIPKKAKVFLKRTLMVVSFLLMFIIILSLVVATTNPQRYLTDFDKSYSTVEYLDEVDGFYLGQVIDSKISGEGHYVLLTGSSYNGEWNYDGMPEGIGKLKINGIGIYEGSFVNGKRDGEGTFTWTNGDKYSGEWVEDKICGNGKIVYSDNSYLVGIFENNQLTSGTFSAYLKIGTLSVDFTSISNDAELTLKNGTKYKGKLENGAFNGSCEIKYHNGDTYIGDVVNNKKSGQGTYTWSNGAYYVGSWQNDMMHGTGSYHYGASSYRERLYGEFENNVPSGTLKYYDDNGNLFSTKWYNGKCISITEA